METQYIESAIKQLEYYKQLGEKTFDQLPDDMLFWQYNAESNSIATIVTHLWGNMRSRWTDFLSSDGEKPWRDRDAEFGNHLPPRADMISKWEEGWSLLLSTLRSLRRDDLQTLVYIRNQGHTVLEAINRQLAHYPYHVGQIVFIGKMAAEKWTSLSIPRGASAQYNQSKFAEPRHRQHFTDEFLNGAETEGSDGSHSH
ncbi:MAG: hypothetical protein JWP27_1284 [Flaviaesturariibacter sp.]|nr:hypothetical protein [Flaviaesturariibacter sp.]